MKTLITSTKIPSLIASKSYSQNLDSLAKTSLSSPSHVSAKVTSKIKSGILIKSRNIDAQFKNPLKSDRQAKKAKILHTNMVSINPDSIKEFGMTPGEVRRCISNHKFDHIKQNIKQIPINVAFNKKYGNVHKNKD